MSVQAGCLDITFKAAANLATKQYHIVYMSAANSVTFAANATTVSIGILQNKPQTSEAAVVRVVGTSKVKMGTAKAILTLITADSAGRGTVAGTDKNWVVGVLLEASTAANDIVELLISRFKASI